MFPLSYTLTTMISFRYCFGCLSKRRLWTCIQNFVVVIKSIVWTLRYSSHSFCTFQAWKQFYNFDTISLIIFSSNSVLGQQLTHIRHLAWAAPKAYTARSIQSEQWYHHSSTSFGPFITIKPNGPFELRESEKE